MFRPSRSYGSSWIVGRRRLLRDLRIFGRVDHRQHGCILHSKVRSHSNLQHRTLWRGRRDLGPDVSPDAAAQPGPYAPADGDLGPDARPESTTNPATDGGAHAATVYAADASTVTVAYFAAISGKTCFVGNGSFFIISKLQPMIFD